MTGAFDQSARTDAPLARAPALPREFPTTDILLSEGGDARIVLDPITGANRYGRRPAPDRALADFASSTASTISARGYAAAEALRARLAALDGLERPGATYARELGRIRGDLAGLCGLGDLKDLGVIFGASGTDLHLIAAALAGGSRDKPLVCIDVEPGETGSGVPDALSGRHFSTRTALGWAVAPSAPAGVFGEFVSVPARDAAGDLRCGADIEEELDAVALAAARDGRRVLLTLTDVSKTGLISPNPAAVLALARRFPNTLDVLVDACQFRLAPQTLRAYLDHGFMVAVTGSKFLTGPTFCGALFVPPAKAETCRSRLLPAGLDAYSVRADWPSAWVSGARLPDEANFGLLLRWEAALAELEAFRAAPRAALRAFMGDFATAIAERLEADPAFEPLPTRPLDRAAIGAEGRWDEIASIFPFLLRNSGGGLLTAAETESVYQSLSRAGVHLGQPVRCGERDGAPLAALRLCNSARLSIKAAVGDPQRIIAAAHQALDAAAEAAAAL